MKADTNPAYAYRDSCLRLLPSYCWYFAVSFKLRQKSQSTTPAKPQAAI